MKQESSLTNPNSALDNAILISFRVCPFVARANIVSMEKGISLETRYIDLKNKPKWFLDKSPTGTVPAMDIDGAFVFESSVITDLIDDLTTGSLYPSDPIAKARNRSWIAYADTIIRFQYAMMIAKDQQALEEAKIILATCLQKLENVVFATPFINGQLFSMMDATYAPILYRFNWLAKRHNIDVLQAFPNTVRWSDALLKRASVKSVHDAEFDDALISHLLSSGSVLEAKKM